jgi:hypothetical protein
VSGRSLILCCTAFLGACRNVPDAYAPPEQRALIAETRPYRVTRVMNMDEPDVPSRFVRDISPSLAGTWRWTGRRPAIDIFMRTNEGIHYVIDFALPQVTFKTTGPVTLSFTVNDHVLERVRYVTSGDKHFEKEVPPEWIHLDRESTVGAEIDKVFASPGDGAKLGFVLVRMGLTQR